MKIPDQLRELIEMGAVQEVIRPLMSGKEAQVYVVRADNELCVAKVYKDVKNRSFRQRTVYAEGRKTKNSRERRAMGKLSRYGRELQEASWQNTEVDMLHLLYKAGVRVPRPRYFLDGVLLMDLVKGANQGPAPRLWDLELTEEMTLQIYGPILRQIVLMLCAGVVHGDLSEYNILLAADGPMIIDFPQAMSASANQNSKGLFIRDVQNITESLSRSAPKLRNTQYGPEIWELYEQSKLRPDSPLTGIWQDPRKKANVAVILHEIESARLDNLKKQGKG